MKSHRVNYVGQDLLIHLKARPCFLGVAWYFHSPPCPADGAGGLWSRGEMSASPAAAIFHLGNYGRHFHYELKGGTKVVCEGRDNVIMEEMCFR